MAKKKKIRVSLRKNRQKQPRQNTLRQLQQGATQDIADLPTDERISGKGELTRHRTIVRVDDGSDDQSAAQRIVGADCLAGRVLTPRGTGCIVQGENGQRYECTIRRLIKSLSSNERTAIVAGDRVQFTPAGDGQGVIERVEPRHGTLSRRARSQEHVLVANVDQVLIVASAADPALKPSLIDRYLISATVGNIRPIICINKVDLADRVELQPVAGLYAQLGYEVVLTSTRQGHGIARLRHLLRHRETAIAGQSGVGKSSLINAVEPGLSLKTGDVSVDTRKGRHTTTNASLLELSFGGWVVDTPGIRQFELWDVVREQVEGYFVEFRPFVTRCKFPDCSHTHEASCGVKRAVTDGFISMLRYESYYKIQSGDPAGN